MPSKDVHLKMADHNRRALEYMQERLADFPDWCASIAFYAALHLVEAVFATDKNILHGIGHERRERCLKQKNYEHIHRHYWPLWRASMVARYLEDSGRECRTFAEFMSPEKVTDKLINHHLAQVEKSVTKLLAKRK